MAKQEVTKLYARRDPEALDKAGNFYIRHISAMTSEGLHEKHAIAAELGWRDERIAALESALARAKNAINRDGSGLAAALGAIVKRADGAWWIAEGRGSYEWDDDRYRDETGVALRGMVEIAIRALGESGKLADVEVRAALATLRQGKAPALYEARLAGKVPT